MLQTGGQTATVDVMCWVVEIRVRVPAVLGLDRASRAQEHISVSTAKRWGYRCKDREPDGKISLWPFDVFFLN